MRIRKGFAPAIVALIIIVLIAVGYAYAASRSHAVASTSSSPAPTPTTSSTQSPSPTPSPSPSPSPTSPPVFLPPEEPPSGGRRYAVIVIEGFADSVRCRGWIDGIGTTTRDWVPAYRRLEGAPYVEVEVDSSQGRRRHVIYLACSGLTSWRVYVDATEFAGQWVGVHVKLYVCGNLVDEKYFYRVHIPSI